MICKTLKLVPFLIMLAVFGYSVAAEEAVVLPSGETVWIEGVGPVYVGKDQQWALMVSYVTEIPLENVSELRKQMVRFFRFKIEEMAEKYKAPGSKPGEIGVKAVVMDAHDQKKPRLGVYRRNRYGFILQKIDGKWKIRK